MYYLTDRSLWCVFLSSISKLIHNHLCSKQSTFLPDFFALVDVTIYLIIHYSSAFMYIYILLFHLQSPSSCFLLFIGTHIYGASLTHGVVLLLLFLLFGLDHSFLLLLVLLLLFFHIFLTY